MEKKLLELYGQERKNWLEWNETETSTKKCEQCGLTGYTEKENKWAGTPRKIIFYEGRTGYPWGCQNLKACEKDKTELLSQIKVLISLKEKGED